MIKVIFDTSVLFVDPHLNKTEMRALEVLTSAKKCELIIPEMVKREFLSQREAIIEAKGEALQKSVNDLLREHSADKYRGKIDSLLTSAKLIHEKILLAERKRIETWLTEMSANVIALEFDHMKATLDSYFQGLPPFPNKKERKDIPDSLIYETIKRIDKGSRIFAVIHDGNLRKAVAQLKGIETCGSLTEFIKKKEIPQSAAAIAKAPRERA